MLQYLRLFEKSNEQELAQHNIDADARRLVLLAIKVPTIIDFAEVLKLKAVKHMQDVRLYSHNLIFQKCKDVFDFMSLFTTTGSTEFAEKVK